MKSKDKFEKCFIFPIILLLIIIILFIMLFKFNNDYAEQDKILREQLQKCSESVPLNVPLTYPNGTILPCCYPAECEDKTPCDTRCMYPNYCENGGDFR